MTTQNAQIAGGQGQDPAADPDAAKYAELARELDIPEGDEAAEPTEPVEPSEPADPPEQRQRPEHVPYAEHENVQRALREARAAQKAADERLAGIMQLVEQSLQRRGQREPNPAAAAEPKLPDVQEDPIGHFNGRLAQLEAALNHAWQGTQATGQQLDAQRQQQALMHAVARSEAEILNPASPSHKADYNDATQYLADRRMAQLARMYPDDSPQAVAYAQQMGYRSPAALRDAVLQHDYQAVAVQALQLGRSPAELFYELAFDAGYQPKPNGKAPASLAARAKAQIAATQRGKAASLSISGGNSGRKGAEDMSLTDLADLFVEDPEMADKVWDQMARAGKLG